LVANLVVNSAAKFFQRAAFSFRFENPSLELCRSRRFAATFFFAGHHVRALCRALSKFDRVEQTFPGQFPIHRLGSGILHGHTNSARVMSQRHRRRHFIYILAARSTGPCERLFKIDIAHAEPRHPLRE